MSKWQRLGLNVFEEWIEESDEGLRRVITPSGYVIEPDDKNIRWGRVSSFNDASMICNSLSYRHIFESFKSLSKASIVYTGKNDYSFKILAQKYMAKRIWLSAIYNKWNPSLPVWDVIIYKKGLSNWPLFIDIGLWKFLNLPNMTLEEFSSWQKLNSNLFFVTDKKPSKASFEIYDPVNKKRWWVGIPEKIKNNKVITALKWHGPKPENEDMGILSSSYIPFSSPEKISTGYVDPVLNYAQSKPRPNVKSKKVLKEVAVELGLSENDLISALSYDQIDAIYLALQKINSSGSFLLADETGYGKGRVLAAISKIAINKGYQVLFFTERKNLFTDFYRDLTFVDKNNEIPLPFLLHGNANITTPNGEKIKVKNKGDYSSSSWIWTTYSQFNRDNKDKIQNLLNWMGNNKTILIMDESQNAAGQSNTAKSIKKIQDKSFSVIFSSATFAKNEDQLMAYRSLFEGKNWEWERLKHAFKSNNEILRSAITLLWASQGSYIRREHPPMSLPHPQWMETNKNIKENENTFSLWWDKALELSSQWSLIQNGYNNSWGKIGSMLFRATREFSILQKQDFLLEQVKESVKKKQKVVIVSDWILSSHVQRLVDNKKQLDEEIEENIKIKNDLIFNDKPSWKESWVSIFDESFPLDGFSPSNPAVKRFKETQEQLNKIIRSLPEWSISPFDDLISNLENLNISCLEISGRTWSLVKDEDEDKDNYKIKSAIKRDRNLIISDFNNEKIDCILLTRAGNSGASLHSGINFKDQRQRHLIEWDVSPDPSVRLQFWGRVRRKDQVNEPERSTILLDTNFERRRYNRDNVKQEKLLSHSGTSNVNRYPDYLGEDGNFIARNWLLLNPKWRKKSNQFQNVDIGQLMSRSIVFDEQARDSLMENIDKGIESLSSWYDQEYDIFHKPSRSVRKKWWWGKDNGTLYWSEQLWNRRVNALKDDVLQECSLHENGKSLSAKQAFEKWFGIWMSKFSQSPNEVTKYHESIIKYWKKNHPLFERGMGFSIIDPLTKERANAIVLGWQIPSDLKFENLNLNQILVHFWVCTMQKPMHLSLAALIDSNYANAIPYNRRASPSWFDGQSFPTKAMVLIGPAWSVASWGARSNPLGELIYLKDEFEGYQWGWKMPSSWTWEDMLSHNRELISVPHAREFIKDFSAPVFWQLSSHVIIKSTPQSDGMFISGDVSSYESLSFNLLKRCGPVKWDSRRENWSMVLSWSNVAYAFNQWFSSGFIPTVESKYSSWYEKTWSRFVPGK